MSAGRSRATGTGESCAALLTLQLDPRIVAAVNPQYPRWERRIIKKRFLRKPVYLDVWIPREPSLFSMLPKVKPPMFKGSIRSIQ